MTPNEFRRIALAMQDASEGEHMAHPDFRANGRIFATLYPDGERGMVKLTPEQQRTFMRRHAAIFSPASGAWGRQGCTMVELKAADKRTTRAALNLAWQHVMDMPPPKKRAPKAAAKATPRKSPASKRAR